MDRLEHFGLKFLNGGCKMEASKDGVWIGHSHDASGRCPLFGPLDNRCRETLKSGVTGMTLFCMKNMNHHGSHETHDGTEWSMRYE
jgi:hypothetical protein